MAESPFESLVTLTVAKCDELAALASVMWNDMAEFDGNAAELAETLEDGVGALVRQMGAIRTAAQSAQSRLGTASTGVTGALAGLGKDVGDVATAFEAAGVRITAALKRVLDEGTSLSTTIHEHAGAFDKDNAALDAGVAHLTGVLEPGCDGAVAALRASIESLQEFRQELSDSQSGWAGVLDALTIGVAERIAGLIRGLAPSADLHASGVIATLNAAIAAHNAMLGAVGPALTEKTTEHLSAARAQVEERYESLESLAGACSEDVAAHQVLLEESASEVGGELERITGELRALDGIGGA